MSALVKQFSVLLAQKLEEARRENARISAEQPDLAQKIAGLEREVEVLGDLQRTHESAHLRIEETKARISALSLQVEEVQKMISGLDAEIEAETRIWAEAIRHTISTMPNLDGPGQQAWIHWLENWHLQSSRTFEPVESWSRYFEVRSIEADALAELERLFEAVSRLELEELSGGTTRSHLAQAVEDETQRVLETEASIRRTLQAAGLDYGRILSDLPNPEGISDTSQLDAIERLLEYLEKNLGRYAASADLERLALEALS